MPNIIVPDTTRCAGCLTCMLRCSFRFEDMFKLSAARIKVKKLVNQPNEFGIIFTPECDGCGICVRYCPYEALTRRKEKVALPTPSLIWQGTAGV